jgi:hypothetical protein
MAVVAITGGTGAPGATTSALALLLAWPLAPGRRVLLAECDPDGGAVLAGALQGRVEAVYGLRNLAVADRRGRLAETMWEQLVDLSPDGGQDRLLLPGLTDPAQAPGLAYTWEPLVQACHELEAQGCDVLLDLGRSGAYGASAPLARRADAVLAVVRSTLRGIGSARPRVAALRADLDEQGTGADALGLVVVDEGPYPAAEVSRQLGTPVLGLLPHAPKMARVLSDGGETSDRRFVRSELLRAARSTADQTRLLTARRRLRLGTPTAAPPTAPFSNLAPQPAPPQPLPPSGPGAPAGAQAWRPAGDPQNVAGAQAPAGANGWAPAGERPDVAGGTVGSGAAEAPAGAQAWRPAGDPQNVAGAQAPAGANGWAPSAVRPGVAPAPLGANGWPPAGRSAGDGQSTPGGAAGPGASNASAGGWRPAGEPQSTARSGEPQAPAGANGWPPAGRSAEPEEAQAPAGANPWAGAGRSGQPQGVAPTGAPGWPTAERPQGAAAGGGMPDFLPGAVPGRGAGDAAWAARPRGEARDDR